MKKPRGLELLLALALDCVLGDPPAWPHPVKVMGHATSRLETGARKHARGAASETAAGIAVTVGVAGGSYVLARLMRRAARPVEPLLLYTCMARRDLAQTAARLAAALEREDLEDARHILPSLVGRDPSRMKAGDMARAGVESVAENLVDGVLSPIFWAMLGGAPGALAFKAVSTLDSMIGHRDDGFLYLGKCAARVDDAANWLTARAAIPLITASSLVLGLDWRAAWQVGWADRKNHPSPNSAHPEAAFAGALALQLGGADSYRDGVRSLPIIGKGGKPDAAHLRQAVTLMNATALLGAIGAFVVANLAVRRR